MLTSTQFCNTCGAAKRSQAKFCVVCGQPQTFAVGRAINSSAGPSAAGRLLKQRYHILRQLGAGGFGEVYQAEDLHFGKALRAIKELSQGGLSPQELQEAIEAFKREAILLAGLMHPNLPRIYDHFSDGGHWYLIMDYVEGMTLEDQLSKASGGQLPTEEVLDLGIKLCTVLHYLHTRQPPIIFRDLKPANIMLTVDKHLYLIDFGIARHFKPGQKKDTVALGSLGYVAPEQFAKAQTQTAPSADIYSLGATLHQLLSGKDPSESPLQFAPLALSSQPALSMLETLIMQMVERNRDKRPASAAVVRQELQRIAMQLKAGPPSTPASISQASPSTTPITKELRLREGNALFDHKLYREALEVYEQAIQLDPNDAIIYLNKGSALYELKRYQEALIAFEQPIRCDSTYALAYQNKGAALYNLGRHQEATAAYNQAARLGYRR